MGGGGGFGRAPHAAAAGLLLPFASVEEVLVEHEREGDQQHLHTIAVTWLGHNSQRSMAVTGRDTLSWEHESQKGARVSLSLFGRAGCAARTSWKKMKRQAPTL